MARVLLQDVCKVYKGNVLAVKDFCLEIKDGEFIVFVGPSGCGKSTTLRMIAGLEEITAGKVYIGDEYVNNMEPKDRDIAMVFQNYALYPHMSVFDNLAYSLRCHKVDKEEIKKKVEEVSELLDIKQYLLRKPKELSGGQRQRVALGRCLIRNPKVFLFDEPLSNLDAKLRVQMRSEISKLHKQVKGTFIYVTHDQTEAMTMGDRIVVMKDGLVQQVDTPVNLYEHPVNVFVATFLGSPQMNIFNVHHKNGTIVLDDSLKFELSEKTKNKMISGYEDADLLMGIRPSDFILGNKDEFDIHITKIDLVEKLGNETLIYFSLPGKEESTLASLKLSMSEDIGNEIYLKIDRDKIHLFSLQKDSILKVNENNYIRETISFDNNKAKVGDYFEIDNISDYLMNQPKDEIDGFIKISTDSLHIKKEEHDDSKIEVNIVAKDVRSDSNVYYAKLTKDGTRITFKTAKNVQLANSSSVNLYFSSREVSLYDSDYNVLSVNEKIDKPIIPSVIEQIGKDKYIITHDKTFLKNKFFTIEKVYNLKEKMILTMRNFNNQKASIIVDNDPNIFAGMIVYIKYKKSK